MKSATAQNELKNLVDEFFVNLQQQAATSQPRPIQQPDRPGPHHVTPRHLIERRQIEEQLQALVTASTAHLYELLQAKFDEMHAMQNELIDLEQKRLAEQRAWQARQERTSVISMCEPGRNPRYIF